MINYMQGKITEINNKYIVLDISNIGYIIYVCNPKKYKLDYVYKLYIYLDIKEQAINLFGFSSIYERSFFLKLLEVKGIGPRIAINLCEENIIPSIICAINTHNISYLQTFPGIGIRSSEQIIFDLKGKFATKEFDQKYQNIYNALTNLGFNSDFIKSKQSVIDNNINKNVEEILTIILKS